MGKEHHVEESVAPQRVDLHDNTHVTIHGPLTIAPPEHRDDRYCEHRLQYDREMQRELGGDL